MSLSNLIILMTLLTKVCNANICRNKLTYRIIFCFVDISLWFISLACTFFMPLLAIANLERCIVFVRQSEQLWTVAATWCQINTLTYSFIHFKTDQKLPEGITAQTKLGFNFANFWFCITLHDFVQFLMLSSFRCRSSLSDKWSLGPKRIVCFWWKKKKKKKKKKKSDSDSVVAAFLLVFENGQF